MKRKREIELGGGESDDLPRNASQLSICCLYVSSNCLGVGSLWISQISLPESWYKVQWVWQRLKEHFLLAIL